MAGLPEEHWSRKVTELAKNFVIKPLGPGKVLQAYPLVQSAVPHLTLEQWREYVRSVYDGKTGPIGRAGVMSAENRDGYIYGLYCHVVEPDIHHGRVLKVRNFVAANLYDSAGIIDRLMDSIVSVARDNGCTAVHVDLPDRARHGPEPVESVVSMFKGAGFRVESVAMCRAIEES